MPVWIHQSNYWIVSQRWRLMRLTSPSSSTNNKTTNRTLNIELHETSVEEKYGMSGLTCAFRLRSRLSRSTKPFNKVLPPTAMTLLYKLCRMSMSHIPALDDTTWLALNIELFSVPYVIKTCQLVQRHTNVTHTIQSRIIMYLDNGRIEEAFRDLEAFRTEVANEAVSELVLFSGHLWYLLFIVRRVIYLFNNHTTQKHATS